MRRPTITPTGRNSTKPRPSLSMSNVSIRREPRNVRDKDHLINCTSIVENFLIEHNYQLTPNTLTNPSAKEVNILFRTIFSDYDPDWVYTSRFEDDVMQILKGIKYPYMSEINRSQFIAITPHSWPVILSMLAWLVEIVTTEIKIDKESFISLFNKHLFKGYLGCMRGTDIFDESEFEADVKNQYKDVFSDIDKKIEVYKEIEKKVEDLRNGTNNGHIKEKKENCVKRQNEILTDLENLKARTKQLAEKKKKYEQLTQDLIYRNEALEREKQMYNKEIEKLKKAVNEQQIKPEDFADMTKDKNEMYGVMERLRPIKEHTIRELSENEKTQGQSVEVLEKMLFDLKNISDGATSYKIYKENNEYKIELEGEAGESEIDELLANIRSVIDDLSERIAVSESKKNESDELKRSLIEELKEIESMVLTKGKFYIEKKASYGAEHKKMSSELEKLENEILNMNMESQHAVLIAEKKYQEKQIEYDRYKITKNMEIEMLTELTKKLKNLLCSVYGNLEVANNEFK